MNESEKNEIVKPKQGLKEYQLVARRDKRNKLIFTVILLFVFLMIFYGLFQANSLRSNDYNQLSWYETKTAVLTIKERVEFYKVINGNDISGFDVPFGLMRDGFESGSRLLMKLKLTDDAFSTMQYSDAEDFTLQFVTDGTDGQYIITVDAAGGSGGVSGKGPKSGKGSFNSQTGEWSGMLK